MLKFKTWSQFLQGETIIILGTYYHISEQSHTYHRQDSNSGGIGIFLDIAKAFNASYFACRVWSSDLIVSLSSPMSSISRYSWDFSVSSSSFCSMRLMRQLQLEINKIMISKDDNSKGKSSPAKLRRTLQHIHGS